MPNKSPIYLMDGGLGTTLADNYNCTFDDSTPMWSSQLLLTEEGRDKILACQKEFVSAGAEVILSATYQINADAIRDTGLEEMDTQRVMRNAVKIARSSFGDKKGTVVLGLGAYGAIMKPSQEYTGDYGDSGSVPALRNFHKNRIFYFLPLRSAIADDERKLRVFDEGNYCWDNLDVVAYETIPRMEEIIAVRDVMADTESLIILNVEAKLSEKKKFWISCVFPGEGFCLPDGSTVPEVIDAMLGKRIGADTPTGVGINCTKIEKIETLVEQYEAAVQAKIESGEIKEWPSLVLYPDGTNGEVYNTKTREWEKIKDNPNSKSWDEMLYGIVKKAQSRGNWKSIYVGGCCKATPCSIAKLRTRLDNPLKA